MAFPNNIVVVSSDRSLSEEVTAALETLEHSSTALHPAGDLQQALDVTLSRSPQLALVEMNGDGRGLQRFAADVAAESPQTSVVAVIRPDGFQDHHSESALLIDAVRAGVKDFVQRPISAGELNALWNRCASLEHRGPVHLGQIVSFISNKGGVGKSTLAVNAACGLAERHPGRVLLIDASLQMGVCSSMLDVTPEATIADAVSDRDRLDITLLQQLVEEHDCGLHLLAAPRTAVEAAAIDDDAISRVLSLARQCYDYVVVDTFPMFDGVVMAVLDLSVCAYVVLESVVPTVLGGVKLIELLEELGHAPERERIVINRFARIPGCLRPTDVAERLGRQVDYVLPYEKKVVTAANLGQPYILRAGRRLGFGKRLHELVREIELFSSHQHRGQETPSTP